MNTYEIVKNLAKLRKVSIAQVERDLDLSNGSISKWAKNSPNSEPLLKVAKYFNTTTDHLLGYNVPEWATKQQVLDVEKALRDNDVDIMYDGIELSDIEKAQIKQIIRTVLWDKIAERENKK